MKLKAITAIFGLKENIHSETVPGEIFELDDLDQADDLIDCGAAEEFVEEEEKEGITSGSTAEELATAKANLIACIALAETTEALAEIVPNDEVDAEILAALDARLAELDEPNH